MASEEAKRLAYEYWRSVRYALDTEHKRWVDLLTYIEQLERDLADCREYMRNAASIERKKEDEARIEQLEEALLDVELERNTAQLERDEAHDHRRMLLDDDLKAQTLVAQEQRLTALEAENERLLRQLGAARKEFESAIEIADISTIDVSRVALKRWGENAIAAIDAARKGE